MPKPKTCLVLGASGVLGGAVARAFAATGWRTLGTGFRRAPAIEPALQFDATQSAEWPRVKEWVGQHAESLDVAVHCIGLARDGLLARMSDEDWRAVLDGNLRSAFLAARTLLPIFVRQRHGHLVLISSWAGRAGRAGQANYAAAKSGLAGLAQSLAREYGVRGVRVNVVAPGVFPSPMTNDLGDEARERLWKDSALREFADLDETARFIAHLAGMRGVTGQCFQLDGRIAPSA